LIYQAVPEDFQRIAKLIVDHSRRPERRCIHSDPRSGAKEALAELEQLHAVGELLFVVNDDQEPAYGCVGAEFDRTLRRAWLRGPFVAIEDTDVWMSAARKLLDALQQDLPIEISLLDSFLDTANDLGFQLYLANGFVQVRLVHVYQSDATAPLINRLSGCVEIRPEHAPSVASLHQMLFPNTYLTAQQIIASADGLPAETTHKVYVYVENDEVLGYVYGSENMGEGVVDFLGVDVSARNRGIGRALLSAIMVWFQIERKLERVTLTVHDERVIARNLYEQAGFRLLYTGVHLRKVK
jgi:ribosomal protein S18 acetylase RimI-like enzyme